MPPPIVTAVQHALDAGEVSANWCYHMKHPKLAAALRINETLSIVRSEDERADFYRMVRCTRGPDKRLWQSGVDDEPAPS